MVEIKSITLILIACGIMCGTTGYADDRGELKSKEKYFIDMPDEDMKGDVGEICDPNKPTPCDSSSRSCVWIPEEMQYMCRSRSDLESKRDANYKRLEKARKLRKNKEQKLREESERDHFHPPFTHSEQEMGRNFPQGRNFKSEADAEISEPNHFHVQIHFEPHNKKSRLANSRQQPGSKSIKTLVVPKYEGLLKSDGKSDATCILKHVIAENVQEARSLEDKEAWIENYKDQICDFKSFFHCTRDLPDYEDKQDVAQFNNPDTREGICRCFESSMVIVDKVCYIPVGFGVKSTCGDNVHIPYPIQPWEGAPPLRPQCAPNSECREGQYWFGKRCDCSITSVFNKITHTCDTGNINIPHPMLLTCIILMSYISHLFFAHN